MKNNKVCMNCTTIDCKVGLYKYDDLGYASKCDKYTCVKNGLYTGSPVDTFIKKLILINGYKLDDIQVDVINTYGDEYYLIKIYNANNSAVNCILLNKHIKRVFKENYAWIEFISKDRIRLRKRIKERFLITSHGMVEIRFSEILADTKGHILSNEYYSIEEQSEHMIKTSELSTGKFGIMDFNGNIIITCDAEKYSSTKTSIILHTDTEDIEVNKYTLKISITPAEIEKPW